MRPIVRHIAVPLLLGDMGIDATHFVLGQHWKTHFSRKVSDTGSPMSVGQLQRWIDDPKPMGLPKDAQNVVILMFAAQTNQTLSELEGNLDTAGWQTFELIKKLSDEHQATAQAILTDLKESLGKDEHVVELTPVLKLAQAQAMRLLEKAVEKKPVARPADTSPPVTAPSIKPPVSQPPPPSWILVDEGTADGLDLGKAKDKLAALESRLRDDRRIQVQISWRVEEKQS